jgi:predicted nucleotidyltransferase
MDKNKVIKIVKEYSNILKKYFSVNMIILFGSYSKNEAKEHSDIDVAVIVDKIGDNSLEAEQQLFKLRRNIDNRIEPILFEKDSFDPSGFFEEIIKTGEIIYQKS